MPSNKVQVGSVPGSEQDDRDHAVGLLRVLVVQREDARQLGPEGLTLGRGRDTGAGGEPAGPTWTPALGSARRFLNQSGSWLAPPLEATTTKSSPDMP